MRLRSPAVLVLLALVAGLACRRDPRRSTYCGSHADTVEACCPEQEYEHLRVLCQQDIDGASTIGGACSQSVREYHDCVAEAACEDECRGGADPCAAYINTMIGACSQSPPPPPLP